MEPERLAVIDAMIAGMRRIAVVGMSRDATKAAGGTPRQLAELGYEVVPVNPYTDEIAGLRSYARLADVPGRIDVVDVFRPSELAGEVAEDAVRVGAGGIWLQLGIVSPHARLAAERAGVPYVEDACLWVEVARRNARPREADQRGAEA